LRAVLAVLGAAAGLDREQGRKLHGVRLEVRPMDLVRAVDEVVERQLEELEHRLGGPAHAGTACRARERRDGKNSAETNSAPASIGQPSSVAAAASSGICARPTPIIRCFMSKRLMSVPISTWANAATE